MTAPLLPFEKAFHDWVDRNGMGWERLGIPHEGAENATTAYRFIPGRPPRRIAFTLHGAGNDALFAWVGLFKRLLSRDTEIFTFDLPGHGRRNRTTFAGPTAVEAVHDALDRCRLPNREVPVHAIGVSLGASVLLHALPTLQAGLASAVLMVAPLRINLSVRAILGEIGTRTLGLVWKEREHYGLTGLIPSFGPFKRDIYPLRLRDPVPSGPFGYVEALNRTLEEMRLEEAATRVTVPTLLLYGDRDRIVPSDQGERIARALRNGELATVDGGTHLSTPLEPMATQRLLTWIEQHE